MRAVVVAVTALTAWACASGGRAVPRPFPGAPEPPSRTVEVSDPLPGTGAEATSDPFRAELVATALALRGTPYRNGGSDPSGFDCSGFVQWVYARHETRLPRETQAQFLAGVPVGIEAVQPGDLVFFETVARGASHVGVVIGSGQFVHAPSSSGVVRVESYGAGYWATRFVGARRVVSPVQP